MTDASERGDRFLTLRSKWACIFVVLILTVIITNLDELNMIALKNYHGWHEPGPREGPYREEFNVSYNLRTGTIRKKGCPFGEYKNKYHVTNVPIDDGLGNLYHTLCEGILPNFFPDGSVRLILSRKVHSESPVFTWLAPFLQYIYPDSSAPMVYIDDKSSWPEEAQKNGGTICARRLSRGTDRRIGWHVKIQHGPPWLLLKQLGAKLRGFAQSKSKTAMVSTEAFTTDANRVIWWGRCGGSRHVINVDELSASSIASRCNGAELKVIDCPSQLSFSEQIQTLATASVLIGPHGAGMSLLMALRPKSAVIEVWEDRYYHEELFGNLARLSGMRYDDISCKSLGQGSSETIAAKRYHDSPMRCDVGAIQRMIESMCVAELE